jgi:hypothetical protein
MLFQRVTARCYQNVIKKDGHICFAKRGCARRLLRLSRGLDYCRRGALRGIADAGDHSDAAHITARGRSSTEQTQTDVE